MRVKSSRSSEALEIDVIQKLEVVGMKIITLGGG